MTAVPRALAMFLPFALFLMTNAAGQTPERYIVLEGNTALARSRIGVWRCWCYFPIQSLLCSLLRPCSFPVTN
jgi:hypothetical protein